MVPVPPIFISWPERPPGHLVNQHKRQQACSLPSPAAHTRIQRSSSNNNNSNSYSIVATTNSSSYNNNNNNHNDHTTTTAANTNPPTHKCARHPRLHSLPPRRNPSVREDRRCPAPATSAVCTGSNATTTKNAPHVSPEACGVPTARRGRRTP